MSDIYNTIKSSTEGYFKDRLSKFYSFAFPISDEEEAKKRQKELRKKYHDARHHVYALVLGADKETFRYSDDGEPSNSSGPPVYNAIKSYDLTNVLVVVVRYFGGKKLGVPGLINAYRTAAEDALSKAEIIQLNKEAVLTFHFVYSQMSRLMYILKKENIKIISQDFSEKCQLTCSVRLSKKNELIGMVTSIRVKVEEK